MKEEVKKREQKSKTPLAFRVSPAAYHAWKAVARNSPDSEARLFEDTVKEVYRKAYANGTLKGELFNVYQIQELFNKYGPFPRVDIRGYEEVQGKHKTTPNLGEEDAIQLLSENLLRNMGELEELLSTGAATYVDRFLNADGFEVDRYATSIGDFEKTKESRSKHSWGRQEATNREMVSVDDVTEDDFENAKAIKRTGHAGDYHVVYQLPDGRRFIRREIEEIPLRLEEDAIAGLESGRDESELPRVQHGSDDGLLFLHLRTCGDREWQIVDQAINWKANDNPKTVAAVAKEFNLDRQVVATYVINAIRKVLYMSLEIDMEKLVGAKGAHPFLMREPCEKLGEILTNQMRADRPAYKWLQKFIVDNASWIIAENLGAELVDESNENDEIHKVYEIDFDDVFWGNYHSGFSTGVAGEWEIHAHRLPYTKTTTFEARLKPSSIKPGEKAKLAHYYPDKIETYTSGAFWTEYHYGDSHIISVLVSEIGSVCSYHSGSVEDWQQNTIAVAPVLIAMGKQKAKYDRIPNKDEIWPLALNEFSPEARKKLAEMDPTVGKSLWRQSIQFVTRRAAQLYRHAALCAVFDDFDNYDPEVGPVWRWRGHEMDVRGQSEFEECWDLALFEWCFQYKAFERPKPETATNSRLLRIYKTASSEEVKLQVRPPSMAFDGKKDGSDEKYYARFTADGMLFQARYNSFEDVLSTLAAVSVKGEVKDGKLTVFAETVSSKKDGADITAATPEEKLLKLDHEDFAKQIQFPLRLEEIPTLYKYDWPVSLRKEVLQAEKHAIECGKKLIKSGFSEFDVPDFVRAVSSMPGCNVDKILKKHSLTQIASMLKNAYKLAGLATPDEEAAKSALAELDKDTDRHAIMGFLCPESYNGWMSTWTSCACLQDPDLGSYKIAGDFDKLAKLLNSRKIPNPRALLHKEWTAYEVGKALIPATYAASGRDLKFDSLVDMLHDSGLPKTPAKKKTNKLRKTSSKPYRSKHIDGKNVFSLEFYHLGGSLAPAVANLHSDLQSLQRKPIKQEDVTELDVKSSVPVGPSLLVIANQGISTDELMEQIFTKAGSSEKPFTGCYGKFMETTDGRTWLKTFHQGMLIKDLVKLIDIEAAKEDRERTGTLERNARSVKQKHDTEGVSDADTTRVRYSLPEPKEKS